MAPEPLLSPAGAAPDRVWPATDMHTHLAPELAAEQRARHGIADRDGRYVVDGRPVGPPALRQPHDLLAYLTVNQLDRAAVSVPPPFYRQHLDGDAQAAWTRDLNLGLLAAVAGQTALQPLAHLPLHDPGAALAEAATVLGEESWLGFAGPAGGRAELDHPELEPVWRLLDEHEATVLLHPAASPDQRLTPYYLGNLLGNPVETAVAAAQLVFGNVLARFPRVRFVLVHCGGVVPAVAGRWQRGADTGRPGVEPLEPPTVSIRRLYVDTLAHSPSLVDLAAEMFGPDRLVLGSDWPFPMGTADPMDAVRHRPEEFRRAVATGNAARALGETPATTGAAR